MARRRRRRSNEVFQEGVGWAIRWMEVGRRRYRAGFATREDAERVLAKVKGEIAQGRAGMPPEPANALTLSQYAEGQRSDHSDGFLERRKAMNHRAWAEDKYRWRKHLEPFFGRLKPSEVTGSRIRAFIEAKLTEGLNPATIRVMVSVLSSLLGDLKEREVIDKNPCRDLPRATMRLMKPTHDPRTTPFIEKLGDVKRIFQALPEPLNIAYAIGALAGLRTGEVFALQWAHVDLPARRIHVRESVKGPTKDNESRVVPILDALAPILAEWKLKTSGEGRVIPPMRCDGKKIDKSTPCNYLRGALIDLKLARPGFGEPEPAGKPQKLWYWCTRHTFASQWVMSGKPIEKLKEILGHYSVLMTERYAHLRPDLFTASDLSALEIDLRHEATGRVSLLDPPPRPSEESGATLGTQA